MITLKHFAPAEFKHPDQMDPAALQFFDKCRDLGGVPWTLTSDFRTAEQNAAASGSSPTSLHLLGRAIDFVPAAGWTDEALARIVDGIMLAANAQANGIELELVNGRGAIPALRVTPAVASAIRQASSEAEAFAILSQIQSHDQHLHLGLFPDTRASRLEIAVD
jgi:hypothetical protein